MLIVNCKNYCSITADSLADLVKAAEKTAARYNTHIAISPPLHLLGMQTSSGIDILAQHVDTKPPGSTTGHIVPELLKDAGVSGSLLNHSEHRLDPETIPETIERLRSLAMTSVLCTQDAEETALYAPLCPDYIAVEPPELIGTGRSVSTERPDIISEAAEAVHGTRTVLLCGAGIVTEHDVVRAKELGAAGILVASGVVKATDPGMALDKLAHPLANR